MSTKKKLDFKKIISYIVLWSFILPIGFLIYRIVMAPGTDILGNPLTRVKTDYILMLVQCVLGIVAMTVPGWMSKKWKIEIPSNMYFLFILFLYCAIFLGEVRNYYYNVPHWDTILHAFSGGMLGALGFSFIDILNRKHVAALNLAPGFVAFFAFCFAVTIGVFWEIYEFSFDALLGLNMQKTILESGVPLVGKAAVADTMKDLITDCIGAGVVAVIGGLSLKNKNGWLESILIKIQR